MKNTNMPDTSEKESEQFNEDELELAFQDKYEVKFDGIDDKEDAKRLSTVHKWFIVLIISMGSLCVTCLSSIWSLASDNFINHFHISHEVSVLGISFFIWALGTGGIVLAPISEYYGRKATYTVGLFLTLVFNLLPEFSENIGGVLFGRFMSGFFASSFMAVASGTFADIFNKKQLASALSLYTASPFLGPGIGPILAGFINENPKNFRWTFHCITIWLAFILILVIFLVPETYEPVLLIRKAKRLRKESGDNNYYAPLEKTNQTLTESIAVNASRPFGLLFKDKMTIILCFYTGFELAIVYLFFVAFPYIFETVYHFKLHQVGLAYCGLIVGLLIGSVTCPIIVTRRIDYLAEKNDGTHIPEFRFFSVKIGIFISPVGLFILGWTSYSHVHWIGPIIGSALFGLGCIYVFNGIFGYTVDAYRLYAASAMGCNSFIRSIMSGVFPLFGVQMFSGMGIHWACTLLALFSCLLIPVAFLFSKYGETFRKQSPYAWA